MAKKPAVDWVVLGPDPFLATCERCGRTEEKPELPLLVDAFVKYIEFIVAKHARCTPQFGLAENP